VSRVFGRGQLKAALLEVLDDLGEAHGYAVLRELQARVGGGWRPSPGAIYPALLALVDSGLLDSTRAAGTQLFRVTDAGRTVLAGRTSSLREVQQRETPVRLGQLLDGFAATSLHRRRTLDDDMQDRITAVLDRARHDIDAALTEG
jgi:DNA-binding PadR family transcriptional regulator